MSRHRQEQPTVPGRRRAWMAPADSAWLGMGHRGGPMVVDAVLMLDGDLDAAAVRALFHDRLLPDFPSLSRRPVRAPGLLGVVTGTALWDPTLTPDLAELVTETTVADGLAVEAVEDEVSALVSAPLDPWATPWRVHVLRAGDAAATAVLVRLHHSLGDGVAMVAVLDALMDDVTVDDAPADDGKPEPPRRTGVLRRLLAATRLPLAVAAALPTAAVIVGHALGHRLPLRDTGTGTCVAWSRAHDLADMKAVARARGVSLNDVLLAAVAGGLRSYLTGQGLPTGDATVIVPVDLRVPGVPLLGRLGNRIGVLFVRLPVSGSQTRARVAAVHTHTRRLKKSVQPASTAVLLAAVGVVPPFLQAAAAGLLGRSADAVVTNVPGPAQERHLGGRRLRQLVFWVPRVGAMTLGVSVFSYAGTVTVGVASAATADGGTGRARAVIAAVDAELDEVAMLVAAPSAP